MRKEAVVAIPVYKETLSPSERLSLEQCVRVLSKHPIVLVCPEGLRLDDYQVAGYQFQVRRFPAEFFRSVADYNRLMLSVSFYLAFVKYRYILIYQLDAFVFSDQLLRWCRQGYDYVGAPWLGADWLGDIGMRRPPWTRNNIVGNGGFSLRRTATFLLLLTIFRRAAARWPMNEDGFWAFFAPSYYPLFRIPSTREALRFAFELNPARCYAMNRGELPFGCHAWEKYEAEFWRSYIPAQGDSFVASSGS